MRGPTRFAHDLPVPENRMNSSREFFLIRSISHLKED